MTTVDMPGLATVGSDVEHAATSFTRAGTAYVDKLGDGRQIVGFTTGTAMDPAADRWIAFLRQLAEQVQRLGADLSTAARDYQATDADAAARTSQAGAETPFGNDAYAQSYGHGFGNGPQ